MRFNLLFSLAMLIGTAIAPPQLTPAANAYAPVTPAVAVPFRPGTVLVSWKPAAAKSVRAALAAEGLEVVREIPELRVLAIAVPEGVEAATAARLARRPDVAFAEPDYIATAQTVPNDPNYTKQWGLTQIGAPGAWDATTGASNIVIAVLDSGIDMKHPDLAPKMWQNPSEVTPNGKDDDGNGYVDDGYGWHFYNNGSNGNRSVQDDYGHGTHVAGIAAAATNNSEGVAGVSWQSPIMTVKVIDSYGNAFYSDIAAGITYAADNGAAIINLSLGGAAPADILCNAVAAAVQRGKLVVAAGGNTDKGTGVLYPAMCPGALAVAATDSSDLRANFSIAGSRIDVSAPGVDIWSTWYATGTRSSTYADKSGTSEAAPFVAGTAALVWSRWPALTADGVKQQLLSTAKDVGLPGKDDETGWGRIDAAAAVAAPAPSIDLKLGVTVSPQTVVAGNALTTTFTISNVGTSAATSVTLRATLPTETTIDLVQGQGASCRLAGVAMTCGTNRLEPGGNLAVRVVAIPTQVGTGELTTSGSVTAAQQELTPADNTQTVKSDVRPTLSGRVFWDGNGDGIRQEWETSGVADAGLYLEQNDQDLAYRASQPPDGAYRFETLAFGAYVLRAELPPNLLLTTPNRIALLIEPAKETVIYFGAWDGVAQPTPTMTPTVTPTPTLTLTPSPTPSSTPQSRQVRTYLPLLVR